MKELYFACILVSMLCYVHSKPNGAPQDSCFYMTPRHFHPHTFRKVWPTQANGLYNITTSADIFRPDRPIRVTLWGPPFKGFMIAAAEEGSKDWPSGIFYSEDGAAKPMTCLGRGDTATHTNNSYKDSVSILWYGPQNMLSEQVQFVATVVVNKSIYYTNIKSNFVRLDATLLQGQAGAEGGANVLSATVDPWLSDQTMTTAAPWGGNRWGSSNRWGSNTGGGRRWDRAGGGGGGWGNSQSGGGGRWRNSQSGGGGGWGNSQSGGTWESTGGSSGATSDRPWGNSGWQSRGQGSSWEQPPSSGSGSSWGSSGESSRGQQSQSSWGNNPSSWGSNPTSTATPADVAGTTLDTGTANAAVYHDHGPSGSGTQTSGGSVGPVGPVGTGSSSDIWNVVSGMSPATIARMLRALTSAGGSGTATTTAVPAK